MASPHVRNGTLGSLAVAALAVYILACSSFSPDDTKILFPAFDARTGDLGVSLYDRTTRQVEQVFVPSRPRGPEGTERETILMRPQWMPDGKRIVAVWPGYSDNDDDVLNVAVLPLDGKGAVRLFAIPGINDAKARLLAPPAVANTNLFLMADSNLLVRLNLETGEITPRLMEGQGGGVLPFPRGDGLFYAAEITNQPPHYDVGTMDPATLAQTRLWQIKSEDMKEEGGGLAFSSDGKRLVVLQDKGGKPVLKVWQGQAQAKTVLLASKEEKIHLGNPCFSPKEDVIWASYAREKEGDRAAAYGLAEVPVQGGAVRLVPLIEGMAETDKDDLPFFQVSLSHDGKTAALCSSYLAAQKMDEFKAGDCALFLVDLSNPERKVTKVPLPMPKKSAKAKKEE